MPFVTKPCPSCGQDHGHSRWTIANSSVMRPQRCKRCGEYFHQTGLGVWFWTFLLVPSGIFAAVHWSLGLAALLVEMVLVSLYINRRKPLAPGPRYG